MSTLQIERPGALADILIPSSEAGAGWMADTALILFFAGITALCAQISIPLPFTPVPITGQTFAVLLSGAALGARRGALSMALYVASGAVGLHTYAGGAGGFAHIIGPTGGYLLSYPIAAALVGALAERGWDRRPFKLLAALGLANIVIFLPGVLWLAAFVGGVGPALAKGLLPFIPGDAIKLIFTSLALPGGWVLVRKLKGPAAESEGMKGETL